jgi:hypothetical protein
MSEILVSFYRMAMEGPDRVIRQKPTGKAPERAE